MALTSELISYQPEWPARYEVERIAMVSRFGALVKDIHHIGSTSIPGISKAKPEIDILIIGGDLSEIDVINSGVSALGYDVRGGHSEGHRYFSKNVGGDRTHKVHLYVESHPRAWEQIIFREYMRDHPHVAEAYSSLKEKLARRTQRGWWSISRARKNSWRLSWKPQSQPDMVTGDWRDEGQDE